MSAAAAVSGAAWTSVVAGLVFLGLFTALAVDRSRVKRRLAAVEASEALLETDLADTRRELESLRDCLRGTQGPVGLTRVDSARVDAARLDVGRLEPGRSRREAASGDPTSAVG